MLPPGTALLSLLLVAGSLGQGARRPSRPLSPINTIQPKANFDAQQEQFYRAEATTLHAAPQGTAMAVNTLRKLDGICWEVRQLYSSAKVPGRFLLQARGTKGPVHVVVGEIDYQGFAVVYLERARRLSVKLYARSLPVSDSALSAFERAVQRANLTEEHTYFFPKYGFCETADQFHILNEVRR